MRDKRLQLFLLDPNFVAAEMTVRFRSAILFDHCNNFLGIKCSNSIQETLLGTCTFECRRHFIEFSPVVTADYFVDDLRRREPLIDQLRYTRHFSRPPV